MRREPAAVPAPSLSPRCRLSLRKRGQFPAAHRVEFSGYLDSHTFLKLQRVEEDSVLPYGLDKCRAPNHDDRSARARQHPAEVPANGARANDRNFRPVFLLAHGVTTLISRSISLSVLYK